MYDAKEFVAASGYFLIPSRLTVQDTGEDAGHAIALLDTLLEEIAVGIEQAESAALRFVRDRSLRKEAYRMTISEQTITVAYADAAGARAAVITLYQAIDCEGDDYVLPCGTAFDWPDSEFRALLIDVARRYWEPDVLRATFRQMALGKMNKAIFHILDSEHFAMHSDAYPELNDSPIRQYSKDELREILDYAAFWGIECIPDMDFPAHALHVLDHLPQVDCEVQTREDYRPSHWAICVGKEEVYEIIEKLLREVDVVFQSRYFMITGDELTFWDLGYWPNWHRCGCCREVARREGFSPESINGYFAYFAKRLHGIITGMGRRMILCNDNIDITVSPRLPRDILFFWWRTTSLSGIRDEGENMKRFLEEGYEVFNVHYPETYIDLYMTAEQLSTWSPVKRPYACPEELASKILGGCMCAWEGKWHYEWTLPSGLVMFGEKLWDHRDRCYDAAYHRRLTRKLLGPATPKDMNVFTPLGGSFFPLDGTKSREESRRGFPERVDKASEADIPAVLEQLDRFVEKPHRERALAGVYADCLRWMQEQLKKQT